MRKPSRFYPVKTRIYSCFGKAKVEDPAIIVCIVRPSFEEPQPTSRQKGFCPKNVLRPNVAVARVGMPTPTPTFDPALPSLLHERSLRGSIG